MTAEKRNPRDRPQKMSQNIVNAIHKAWPSAMDMFTFFCREPEKMVQAATSSSLCITTSTIREDVAQHVSPALSTGCGFFAGVKFVCEPHREWI
jgi:hypothetical protein